MVNSLRSRDQCHAMHRLTQYQGHAPSYFALLRMESRRHPALNTQRLPTCIVLCSCGFSLYV